MDLVKQSTSLEYITIRYWTIFRNNIKYFIKNFNILKIFHSKFTEKIEFRKPMFQSRITIFSIITRTPFRTVFFNHFGGFDIWSWCSLFQIIIQIFWNLKFGAYTLILKKTIIKINNPFYWQNIIQMFHIKKRKQKKK